MTVGERIKKIRKEANITQNELAERLGITQGGVSWIESNKCNVGEQTIRQIAKEFNVSVEWIKTGTGEQYQKTDAEIVHELEDRYKLSAGARKLLEMFLNMPPDKRTQVAAAFLNLYGIEIPTELTDYDSSLDVERKDNAKKVKAVTKSSHSENGFVNM